MKTAWRDESNLYMITAWRDESNLSSCLPRSRQCKHLRDVPVSAHLETSITSLCTKRDCNLHKLEMCFTLVNLRDMCYRLGIIFSETKVSLAYSLYVHRAVEQAPRAVGCEANPWIF